MKPVHQTIFGPPLGNCLQAAVASILELPLEAVPNFCEAENQWDALEEFLSCFDLQPLALNADDWKCTGWHLIQGRSPRGRFHHVLVARNGEPVHDPLPGGSCKLDSQEFFIVFVARMTKGVQP